MLHLSIDVADDLQDDNEMRRMSEARKLEFDNFLRATRCSIVDRNESLNPPDTRRSICADSNSIGEAVQLFATANDHQQKATSMHPEARNKMAEARAQLLKSLKLNKKDL